jgi:hypothetical protein
MPREFHATASIPLLLADRLMNSAYPAPIDIDSDESLDEIPARGSSRREQLPVEEDDDDEEDAEEVDGEYGPNPS